MAAKIVKVKWQTRRLKMAPTFAVEGLLMVLIKSDLTRDWGYPENLGAFVCLFII